MADRDDDIVARAHKHFKAAESWESDFRQRFKDDMKFLYADSDNQEQWPANVRARRTLQDQPMVTINKTHTHWLHVVNYMKENKPAVRVHPTGESASYEAAQIFEGIVRHIEYISDAQTAYDIAAENQVGGGIGYWRLTTEYADEDSFDQEIYIREVPDPMSVIMDPNIKKRDGSDAKFAFVYKDMPREEFERKYPAIPVGANIGRGEVATWIQRDMVKVAEYYEVEESKEWLYAVPNDDGSTRFVRESDISPEERKLFTAAIKAGAEGMLRRRVDKRRIRKYIIAGNKVAEKSLWAGKYIPIIRLPGEETVFDGKLDRKGLVRYMKDAQRAYNYNASAALEYGALQSKSPYMAPVDAINGLENYWQTANRENHGYLPYNHMDENGNPVPPPQRQQPPSAAPVFSQGMADAAQEMMMASGQYESTFSEQGNEVSGVSIENRRNQGERATFHFVDAQANAIRFCGKQLIDLIPKIYDTKRIIRILAEDGTETQIQINPDMQQPMQKSEDPEEAKVRVIFNPAIGTYDVVAEVGPNYDTRRKEAFEAMTGILTAQPALTQVIGDLYMKTADFPLADQLQERLRNWIPPQILGTGPSPQEQQMQQQLQQAGALIQQLQQELKDKTDQLTMEKQRLDMDALNHLALRMENEREDAVNAFKAETERLKSLMPMMSQDALEAIVRKALGEVLTATDPGKDLDPAQIDPSNAYASGIQQVLAPLPTEQPQQAPQPQQ